MARQQSSTPSGELALRITAARVVGNEQLSWPLEGQSLVLTYDAERDMLDGTYRNLANGVASAFRMRRVR